MIRDISPPDAHFATSTGDFPVEEKRNRMVSEPSGPGLPGSRTTSNTARSSSSERIELQIFSEKPGTALALASCKSEHASAKSFSASPISCSRADFLASSTLVSAKDSESLSLSSISSET